MPTEIERISGKIARSPSFDGYSLWRILKDVNNQIFELQRARSPVPIELGKLRAVVAKAQELRQKTSLSRSVGAARSAGTRFDWTATSVFDPFDFVDHYRALGGCRVAVEMGRARVEIRQWNEDTSEAEDFWARRWAALGPRERSAAAQALLLRGRY
ncbi:hypothetical protein [Mesorhizobium sp. 1B3]|uniref:hypothetical protein n=1 Tax=Mesorhizobium sp. 1B3 TaxID=3243599 RepID=UPI003D99DA1B